MSSGQRDFHETISQRFSLHYPTGIFMTTYHSDFQEIMPWWFSWYRSSAILVKPCHRGFHYTMMQESSLSMSQWHHATGIFMTSHHRDFYHTVPQGYSWHHATGDFHDAIPQGSSMSPGHSDFHDTMPQRIRGHPATGIFLHRATGFFKIPCYRNCHDAMPLGFSIRASASRTQRIPWFFL